MSRRCFLPPLPEHDLAADWLSQAADALLRGDLQHAEILLVKADLKPLEEYRYSIAGPINPAIIRQTRLPVFERLPNRSRSRMPGLTVTKEVLARDGYRCRFCGTRIVVKEAQKALTAALPKAARWGPRNQDCHFGLAILRASIDHVVPFQRGGSNELKNLVTTCNPCQFGRGHFLLDEVELEDPMKYPPVIDSWDGIARLRGIRMSVAV